MARKLVPGFPEMHRFCLANRPTHCPLRGNFHPPFFLLWWVWFDPKPIWQQNWWYRDQKPHFYTHTTFLAGKWHKSSPPLSPLTPNSIIFMQRCYIYVYRTIGWPQMCSSGKGHEFPLFWVGNGWPDLKLLSDLKFFISFKSGTCRYVGIITFWHYVLIEIWIT